ncbi:MAG: hypothetical protein IT581_04340 [Verrucomicrobiales bacterium]|nr:hypothetical protein [Verrucomicrobiales bacterium]
MKFVASFLVTCLIAGVLGVGLLAASHGHGVWLLALGIIAFLGLFIGYGCRTH